LYSKDAKGANIATHPFGILGAQIGILGARFGNLENIIVRDRHALASGQRRGHHGHRIPV
jgi:hypothetical protein